MGISIYQTLVSFAINFFGLIRMNRTPKKVAAKNPRFFIEMINPFDFNDVFGIFEMFEKPIIG